MSPDDRTVPGAIPRRLALAHFDGEYADEHEDVATVEDGANVLTSLQVAQFEEHPKHDERLHAPVLDLDVPHVYMPSSTPGHAHLLLDVSVPEPAYFRLLDALVECGLIERGYVEASKARGYTSVRLPWVKKEPAPDLPPPGAAVFWDVSKTSGGAVVVAGDEPNTLRFSPPPPSHRCLGPRHCGFPEWHPEADVPGAL